LDERSPVSREAHAGICERRGVKLPPATRLLEPEAEDVAVALEGDPQGQVARAAPDRATLADLEHQRVEEDHRVDVLQWPGRPRARVVHHAVGDL
jgi:hypothetical protein